MSRSISLILRVAEEEDLALQSASEAEDDEDDGREDDDDAESRRHLEIMQRTLKARVKERKTPSPPPPIEDDSVTEDSDTGASLSHSLAVCSKHWLESNPCNSSNLPLKSTAKRRQHTLFTCHARGTYVFTAIEEEDDSATESEPSDWDKDFLAKTKVKEDASCSETESDNDDNEPIPVGCVRVHYTNSTRIDFAAEYETAPRFPAQR